MNTEIQNVSPLKTALKWGLILGLTEVVSHLVFYLMGKPITFMTTVIYFILLVSFFIVGIQNYRDKELGGFISWKQGFVMAFLIGLFGALVYMTYYIVIVSLDKQVFIDANIQKLTEGIEKMKDYISDEEALAKIEDSMVEGIDKIKAMSPLQFGINQLTNSIIATVLVGLIIPALLKKKDPNSFEI